MLSATLPEDAPPSHPIHLLLSILQNVWTGEDAPTEWETGTFCPIFKKGDTTSSGNWRPVILLDVTYKIMTAIIARRMSKVLKKEGLEEQYGNKGCADAVTALKIALQTRREHSLNSWVVFVDLVKTFDTVSHPLMLAVLKNTVSPPSLSTQ